MFTAFFLLDQFFFFRFATQVTKSAFLLDVFMEQYSIGFYATFSIVKFVQPMDKNQWHYLVHFGAMATCLYLGFVNLITVSSVWETTAGYDSTKKKIWWNIWSRATLQTIQFVKCSTYVCRHLQRYMFDVVAGNLHNTHTYTQLAMNSTKSIPLAVFFFWSI